MCGESMEVNRDRNYLRREEVNFRPAFWKCWSKVKAREILACFMAAMEVQSMKETFLDSRRKKIFFASWCKYGVMNSWRMLVVK